MTQDLTTTSILALFQTNKEERQSFALDLVSKIENGEVDPLKIHLQIKCMEDIIKLLNDNTIYKKAVLEAAEKFPEKSFTFMNAKIEKKEVGVKYNFENCADPIYKMLEQQTESLKDDLKKRGDLLKTVPAKGMELVMADGEVVTVYPPSKSSTTSIAVTLK
jgi:hypothetical protein